MRPVSRPAKSKARNGLQTTRPADPADPAKDETTVDVVQTLDGRSSSKSDGRSSNDESSSSASSPRACHPDTKERQAPVRNPSGDASRSDVDAQIGCADGAGQDQVDNAQKLLNKVFKKESTIAAPLADIGSSWMRVAWLGLVAMSCIIPGASIIVVPFMFVSCGWQKWHLLHYVRGNALFQEFWMWTILFLNVYNDIFFVIRSWETFREGTSLRSIVGQMQVNQISDILSVGSIVLWRILSIHIIEVSAQVHWHKCEELRKCSKTGVDQIVRSFANIFPDSWQLDQVLDSFSKVSQARWSVTQSGWSFEKVLIRASTFLMFAGMLLLQVRLLRSLNSFESQEFETPLGESRVSHPGVSWSELWSFEAAKDFVSGPMEGVSWWDLFVKVITALQASLSWNNTISGIFSSTMGMKRNQVQLLVFSCISSGSVEYLNATERQALEDSKLKADERLKRKYLHFQGSFIKPVIRRSGQTDGEPKEKPVAQKTQKIDDFDRLVLANVKSVEDVEAWWAVRRYIQIDFKDESAIMDACGAIVFLLLLGLLFTGIVEWSLHSDPFSPGFLLILMLSSVLTFAMFRVFEVCIGINNVLARDTLFLTEAMLKVVHLPDHTKVIAALQAIERRLSVYDDKQKLLGITVSANLRNGWIASLVVTFFSWGSRFMTPVLSHIDVDNLQHLILNKTNLVRRAKMA